MSTSLPARASGTHVHGRAERSLSCSEPLGFRPVDRFGDPKIDDLWNRLTVHRLGENVRRFQVSVKNALAVCVFDAATGGRKRGDALANGKLVFVCKLGDRASVDHLHGEVGPTGVARAGLEDLGHVRMRHGCHRLLFQ